MQSRYPAWFIRFCRAAFLALAAIAASCQPGLSDDMFLPSQSWGSGARGIAFVPDAACTGCHQDQTTAWQTSHHFHAMALATGETVLGNFDDVTVEHDGTVTRFFRRDGGFFLETDGPDGARAEFEALYTFGVEPLQQYLVALPGGRLQAFTVAWDTGAGRWFDLYPGEELKPGDSLHWTGRLNNWNGRCAECHSTNLRTSFDLEARTYQTEWSAINVGCQACHGPGAAHVAWAGEDATEEQDAGSDHGLVVDYGDIDPAGLVEICARCHARRHRITVDDEHGRPFLDDFVPALLREELYHADGQILEEVYVYGSFVQSRMSRAGVTCNDCHDAHTGRLVAEGNAVCTQCHNPGPPARFNSLRAAAYDAPEHHHHELGGSGAQCVDCHMPAQVYMVVDPRRDHSLRVPRPDLSIALDTPNACTGCHAGRSSEWAADEITAWFGLADDRPAHYGAAIAAGREGDPEGAAILSALAQDSEAPAIARATALDMLPQYGVDAGEAIVAGLEDDEPLVRAAAARGLALASPEQRVRFLFPLLDDPVRAVRIEAARLLAPIPVERMEPQLRAPFEAALAEYVAVQTASAETPEAHLNLGGLWRDRGQQFRALVEYRTAIELAPDFVPARLGLANLHNALGRNDLAESELRIAIDLDSGIGESHYLLGLLLAEMERPDEAVEALAAAAQRMPGRARVHYNLALALQQTGRPEEAEPSFLTANRLEPGDPDTLQALAIFYAGQERWEEAVRTAEELVRLYPDAPGPQQLLQQIRRDSGG